MTTQAAISEALVDPHLHVPEGILVPAGESAERRFAVYRNNVIAGFMNALRSKYPVALKCCGPELFAELARAYAYNRPTRCRLMSEYGDDFGEFTESIADIPPWLPDLARLEAARLRAYHSEDISPLVHDDFSIIDPDELAESALQFHPAAALIHSVYPVFDLWAAEGGLPITGENDRPQSMLVTRPEFDSLVTLLSPSCATFLQCPKDGRSLRESAEMARARYPEFDLTSGLHVLLQARPAIGFTKSKEFPR